MQQNSTLPPGFVTVEDAIKLIQSDKRNDAKVDLQFLVNNIPYLETKHNFNIRKLKTTPEGKVIRDGSVYVQIFTEYERQILLKAIQDAYTERTNIKFNPDDVGVNYVSSMIDQESNQMSAMPQAGATPVLKANETIQENRSQVIQG